MTGRDAKTSILKRITYLEKLDGMTSTAFSDHWATTHAAIARDLPGVTCYLQNHVIRSSALGGAGYRVDGIVELWFDSPQVVSAASDSPVAERLVADELLFLSGLTGASVAGGEPHEPWPYKVWVLGQRDPAAGAEDLPRWSREVLPRLNTPLGSELNLVEEDTGLLLREALRHEPRIPEIAVAFGFRTEEQAGQALDRLAELTGSLTGILRDIQLYLAEEKSIIAEPVH